MQIKWITRPNLPPLGFDLAEFRSAGAFQFQGRLTEGRPIYAKYRMGWLTVILQDPDEMVLEAHIGPAFHGEMSPEQVCDLAGMTIRGVQPAISMSAEELREWRYLDWSGATTYWQPLFFLTRRGLEAIDLALLDAPPGLEARLSTRRPLPIGKPPPQPERPLEVADLIDGRLFVEFATADETARAFVEALAARHFFRETEMVDIADGAVTQLLDAERLYSRDLIAWHLGGPDRFLRTFAVDDPPRLKGVRPSASRLP